VRWEKASVGYGDGPPVLKNITLRLDPDDRIALLGSNGNGKSTFAKLLCGKLQVSAGEMRHPPRITMGYFAQHQLDELSEDLTPYEYISSLMPDATVAQRRAKLGAVGFGAALADSKCSTLSGGEKARLLFMLATFHGPHILILDEPTNHLDVDSREALIMAINDYEGAVILISHDRHIIETCADSLWLVRDGTVKTFDGDMDEYTDIAGPCFDAKNPSGGCGGGAKAPKNMTPVIKKKIGASQDAEDQGQDHLLEQARRSYDLCAEPRRRRSFAAQEQFDQNWSENRLELHESTKCLTSQKLVRLVSLAIFQCLHLGDFEEKPQDAKIKAGADGSRFNLGPYRHGLYSGWYGREGGRSGPACHHGIWRIVPVPAGCHNLCEHP
jgi:ABC-type multidrug transport system ATPase subunit